MSATNIFTPIFDQAFEAARTFQAMTEAQVIAILDKTRAAAIFDVRVFVIRLT